MKTDRLVGILSVLLQTQQVTAPELARRFEVSRRTINRDIEALCAAGIPIVTRQGAGGGIAIMDGYKLDRTLLTPAELRDILAGLRGLDSVSGTHRRAQLMEKLSAGSSSPHAGDSSVLIDLASWYGSSLAPQIALIRRAIEECRELTFRYYAPGGESDRRVEPYSLVFHWSSWYLWGFCKAKEDFRLFKLNRMAALCATENRFTKRAAPLPDLSNERVFPAKFHVKALFTPDCKWRLVEEFGASCFKTQADGRLAFETDYTNEEEFLTWLLTFRDKAELTEPAELRERLAAALAEALKKYT